MKYRLPGVFQTHADTGVNGSLWTLSIEFTCYLYVAILSLTRQLSKITIAILLTAAIISPIIHFEPNSRFLNNNTIDFFRYFAIGMLFYLAKDNIKYNTSYLAMAIISLIASCIYGKYFNELFILSGAYIVFYIALHPQLNLRKLTKHGDFSYGLYIFAFPVQQSIIHFLGKDLVTNLALTLIITIPLAVMSWNLVEKPCLALKNNTTTVKRAQEILH